MRQEKHSAKPKPGAAKKILSIATGHLFMSFLLFYLLIYVVEDFATGFITNVISLNTILAISAGAAFVFFLTKRQSPNHPQQKQIFTRLHWTEYLAIVVFASVFFLITYLKLEKIGIMALVISLLGGVITFLLLSLALRHDHELE